MSEWKQYCGSDEQIAEMWNALNGFVHIDKYGHQSYVLTQFYYHDEQNLIDNNDICGITHYLICNPHPLADMICRQAQTGQPVWYKRKDGLTNKLIVICTTTPDWNIPGAEYSFAPFNEVKK